MPKARVTIYSRPGCHLCDKAKEAILTAACPDDLILEEINIDTDPELRERYKFDIPVIAINGVEAFRHHVDPVEFKKRIRS
jgi:glutaredoxin